MNTERRSNSSHEWLYDVVKKERERKSGGGGFFIYDCSLNKLRWLKNFFAYSLAYFILFIKPNCRISNYTFKEPCSRQRKLRRINWLAKKKGRIKINKKWNNLSNHPKSSGELSPPRARIHRSEIRLTSRKLVSRKLERIFYDRECLRRRANKN